MPKSTRKAKSQPGAEKPLRVMLVLEPALVRVVDLVIANDSLPGVKMTRQDAIRTVLAKLGKLEPFTPK